jgi:hypothetical protein
MEAALETSAICHNCGEQLVGNYCHNCGQRPLSNDHFSIRAFLEHALRELFVLDKSLPKTLKLLFFKPGELTKNYIAGKKTSSLAPLQIFLLSNLLFFLLRANIFQWRLKQYLVDHNFGRLASELVNERIRALHESLPVFESRFNLALAYAQKTYIIFLIPVLALVLKALYGRRHYFVEHMIYALHFFSFFLLYFLVLGFVMRVLMFGLVGWFLTNGWDISWIDNLEGEGFLLATLLPIWLVYIVSSLRRAYADNWSGALIRGSIVVAAIFPMILLYQKALFFITFYL